MIQIDHKTKSILERTWNRKSAQASMERWLSVCEYEGWGRCPENLDLLVQVFGASWYFTRFIFFRGREIAKYFDHDNNNDFSTEKLRNRMLSHAGISDPAQCFDNLRISKNESMLQLLLAQLKGQYDQEQTEAALTNLAEATLWCALQLLMRDNQNSFEDISIIAMGRMAGREMNYGSDLDLIFLYSPDTQSDSTAMTRQIQALLRYIALPAPCGTLYDIDMRLRPHGSSGTLISPAQYFIEYHNAERPVWERQMMTRCRSVIDNNNLAQQSIDAIAPAIYRKYDEDNLRTEIVHMRKRVQTELGNPRGKYEIKRGVGGIMDIDFLTHFLQLLHGHTDKNLQTPSTRMALRKLENTGIIKETLCNDLLEAYNFLKKIEGCLRLTDLKSISTFSQDVNGVHVLARAMGYIDEDFDRAAHKFLENYQKVTQGVRRNFISILGEV
ncbi:MAG: hypothetical protein HY356_02725 [Gammaproteobacteria bacterium]|nr:hypothetical protein [Gammaproteobacteria bacterium]